MALHIRSADVDKLARNIARRTGETLTEAIKVALAERLERLKSHDEKSVAAFMRDIREIRSRLSPEFRNDKRTSREMIEELYDEDGLPR
jgi:antitoxin VapB